VTKRENQKAGFGYGKRNSLINKTFSPGPGAYDSKLKIGETGKFYMG
jgi:hypothetical protein